MMNLVKKYVLFDGEGGSSEGGVSESLFKTVSAGGLLDFNSASKAMKSAIPDLAAAMEPLQNMPGIGSSISEIGGKGLLGGAFGPTIGLNMKATPDEMIGGKGGYEGSEAGHSGGGDHEGGGHSGGGYSPHEDSSLSSAGHQILSGGSSEHEDHSHVPQVQPSIGGSSRQSGGHDYSPD